MMRTNQQMRVRTTNPWEGDGSTVTSLGLSVFDKSAEKKDI